MFQTSESELDLLAVPECRTQHHQQGEDLQATQEHGKREHPLGRVGDRLEVGGYVAKAGAQVVHAGGDGAEGGHLVHPLAHQEQHEHHEGGHVDAEETAYRVGDHDCESVL